MEEYGTQTEAELYHVTQCPTHTHRLIEHIYVHTLLPMNHDLMNSPVQVAGTHTHIYRWYTQQAPPPPPAGTNTVQQCQLINHQPVISDHNLR